MTKPSEPPVVAPSAADRVIEPSRFRPPVGAVELPAPRVPWGSAAAGLALAIVAWAAWYVLTARSVGITTVPAGAAVTMLEWPALRVGDHWLLRPGPRRVRVEAPGYAPFEGDIEVTAAHLQSHAVTLERLPGHLRVAVAPVARAELLVDGRSLGTVPGLVRDVPAGTHDVEVQAPRYLSFHAELEIEGKGIEQALDITLDPAWAVVDIDTVPAGAAVRVDREPRGETPVSLELLAGRRVVELSKEGYKPWRRTLTIEAGKPVDLGQVVLAEADGRLELGSTPAGANVTVDGEYRGRTPLALAVSPGQAHALRLVKEGYQGLEQRLEIASGETRSLALELAPELGTIRFETRPAEAELLIDGEPRGSASQTLRLPAYEHEVTVRAPGYATYQTQVTPRKGVAKRYRIRLKTTAEARAEDAASGARAGGRGPARGTITTGAGQRMKLFTGGRATLGAGPREPGHQDDAPRREVRLERPFYLALEEVNNGQFRGFLANHVSAAFEGVGLDDDSQPVTGVSWTLAALYCNWLSRRDGLGPFYRIKYGEVLGVDPAATGYRLPTEAEWEWAARTAPEGAEQAFAWGGRFPPREPTGNYADRSAAALLDHTLDGYDDGFAGAAPVGSFAPNARGLYDLDGNVAEWVHDVYAAHPPTAAQTDPMGPPRGATHVIKGASWRGASAQALHLGHRESGDDPRPDVGFRLARYAQ